MKDAIEARQRVPELVAGILARRGMGPEEMERFLWPDYEAHLYDPFLMTDMDKAVARLTRAAEQGERVVVYGDYDIDGITASAVLIEGLRALGVEARSYIPDRFEEGYGINQGALGVLKDEGATLVVSVDCGITSVREAAWAREHGLDLVITDHHTPPEILPEAIAVVNPKRPGDGYPFKDLCGAGVAFKLVQALASRTGKPAAGQEKWLLDLVALGTVCDVVTLVDENRVLAYYGIMVMRRTRRVGLRALAAVGEVAIEQIGAGDLGFVLGPRMNAAGRLEHAARSLELVMTDDAARAAEIAAELDALNRRRRAEQEAIFKAADEQAAAYAEEPVLVLADADWSHGVVGIVASKMAEKWRKPTLIAQVLGEEVKGSARSVGTFNMVEGLRSCGDLLTKFGGHFYAAGYTLPVRRLEELRARLAAFFIASGASAGAEGALEPELWLELGEAGWDVYDTLRVLEPFGSGNPEPLVGLEGVVERIWRMGTEGQHLRVRLGDGAGGAITSVGFGLAVRHPELAEGQRVRVAGFLNKNVYRGEVSLQLMLKEITYE